jgi:hypothetical protein
VSLLHIALCSLSQASEPLLAIREWRPIQQRDFTAIPKLSIEPARVNGNGYIAIQCELDCTKGSEIVYNACLDPRFKAPAYILIASVDGKFSTVLLNEAASNPKGEEQQAKPLLWTWLRESSSIGRELKLHISSDPKAAQAGELSVYLPPGDYHVQLVYRRWLVAFWRGHPGRAGVQVDDGDVDAPRPYPGLTEGDMDQPIGISKPVRLTVTDGQPQAQRSQPKSEFSVELRPEHIRGARGEQREIEVRLSNRSKTDIEVYNPFLHPLLWTKRAIRLNVMDNNRRIIGDVLYRWQGSSIAPSELDWVHLPPGAFATRTVPFNISQLPGASPVDLAPGRYFIEAEGLASLVVGRPSLAGQRASRGGGDAGRMSFAEWTEFFPGPVVFKSNQVQLDILPNVKR